MRILDLFCGAGGASMGYHQAWPDAEIVGVDNVPMPHYPFTFVQGDAMNPPVDLDAFDLIHASPPCQEYSITRRTHSNVHPELVDDVRVMLRGYTYVIENVVGAPMPTQPTLDGAFGTVLCGTMFGLRLHRHRLFESSEPLPVGDCGTLALTINPYNSVQRRRWATVAEMEGFTSPTNLFCNEMDVGWMSQDEGLEAIPPAYTEWIGQQLSVILTVAKRKEQTWR